MTNAEPHAFRPLGIGAWAFFGHWSLGIGHFQKGATTLKIAVIGTGYVGLVTATCFAESGNDVVAMDCVAQKIELLEAGRVPIYEPGLNELVQRNRREGRLTFTTNLARAVGPAQLVFVAVGTPQGADGGADLKNLWDLASA